MKFLKSVISLLIIIIFVLSGCQTDSNKLSDKFDKNIVQSDFDKSSVENENFSLTWNDVNKCIYLNDKHSGKIWSTIPYEYLICKGNSSVVKSPLNLVVSDVNTLKITDISGSKSAVEEGRVIVENTKNGFRVTYYFDKQSISVPVLYELCEDSLSVTLETTKICEGGNYKVLSVDIAPFFCSSSNKETNYLFIPSNCGAIMNTQNNTLGTRKYSGAVYGNDVAHLGTDMVDYISEIKMPVFGAKDGDNSLFAIIENGAEYVTLQAEAGNIKTGFSAVWPSVSIRGNDVIETSLPQAREEDISYLSELVVNDNVTIRYVPLSGFDSDYNGMAKWYRNYLKVDSKKSDSYSPYSLSIYGGALTHKLFLGVPYNSFTVLTSWEKVQNITSILFDGIGLAPQIQLVGFGKSGLNYGQIASGFDFSSKIGSNKIKNAFLDYCKENQIHCYFNYELLRFNKSTISFNKLTDSAKTASNHTATQHLVDVALAGALKDQEYSLLKRAKINKAAEKLIKTFTKLNYNGVGLNSLGNITYSDYSSSATACKGRFPKQTQDIIKQFKNSNISVSFENANIYAALLADTVFACPVEISKNTSLDQGVPFYQEVLGGSCALYSPAVNASSSNKKMIMLSAAYGLGLNFDCIDKYSLDLNPNEYSIYSAVFDGQTSSLIKTVKGYIKDFSKFSDSHIVCYEMLNESVSETTFENNTKVLANHSNSNIVFEKYKFQPYEYIVIN